MNHSEKMHGQLLKASGETAAFLEPTNTTLNHITTTVALLVIAEGSTRPAFSVAVSWRYDCTDPVCAQPVANALSVIGFITTNPSWSRAPSSFGSLYLYARDQGFELG